MANDGHTYVTRGVHPPTKSRRRFSQVASLGVPETSSLAACISASTCEMPSGVAGSTSWVMISPLKVEYIALIVVCMLIQLTVDGGPVYSCIGRPMSAANLCTIDAAASEPVAIAEATCGICVAMVSPAAKTPGTVV